MTTENSYLDKIEEELLQVYIQRRNLENKEKRLRGKVLRELSSMDKEASFGDGYKIKRVNVGTRTSLDMELLRESSPRLYEQLISDYGKTTSIKEHIRISVYDEY